MNGCKNSLPSKLLNCFLIWFVENSAITAALSFLAVFTLTFFSYENTLIKLKNFTIDILLKLMLKNKLQTTNKFEHINLLKIECYAGFFLYIPVITLFFTFLLFLKMFFR